MFIESTNIFFKKTNGNSKGSLELFVNKILRLKPVKNKKISSSKNTDEFKYKGDTQTFNKDIRHIKACVHYFSSILYFSPNDGPSQTMENVFYFI